MRPDDELRIKIDQTRLRPHDVDRLICNNRKLGFYTGWSPVTGFREGLVKTVDWFRENGSKFNFRVMK